MCSASQDWRLFLGSILTVGGLLALWFYVNPDLAGLGVYLVKYRHKNETNTRSVNKVLPICKRNTTVDVYGDPGCPDNAHRQHFCALFQAWTSASLYVDNCIFHATSCYIISRFQPHFR